MKDLLMTGIAFFAIISFYYLFNAIFWEGTRFPK